MRVFFRIFVLGGVIEIDGTIVVDIDFCGDGVRL